jgi:hypothetical protein
MKRRLVDAAIGASFPDRNSTLIFVFPQSYDLPHMIFVLDAQLA